LAGCTQKQLAEMIGITDKAVSKWERGINYPDLSLLEPLARVLETSVADLLGLEDSPESNEALETTTKIWMNEKEELKKEFRNRIISNLILAIVVFAVMAFLHWYTYDIGGALYLAVRFVTILWGTFIGNCVYMLVKFKKVI